MWSLRKLILAMTILSRFWLTFSKKFFMAINPRVGLLPERKKQFSIYSARSLSTISILTTLLRIRLWQLTIILTLTKLRTRLLLISTISEKARLLQSNRSSKSNRDRKPRSITRKLTRHISFLVFARTVFRTIVALL